MTILDLIARIKDRDGQVLQVNLPVKVGDVDIHALGILEFLYNELPKLATYADAERVLIKTIWWHVTLNTLCGAELRKGEKANDKH